MRIKSLTEVYSAADIDERVRALAHSINADYAGRDVVAVCTLKGAFMFFSDLLKRLDFSPRVEFIRLASYGAGDTSSGEVRFSFGGDLELEGKDVLIVEDIVDSGRSMDALRKHLLRRNVKTLRIAALVDKLERRELAVDVDYAGFVLSDGFLVGYGLDYAERFRQLPALYVLELED